MSQSKSFQTPAESQFFSNEMLILEQGHLTAPNIAAYNLMDRDFTVSVMIQPKSAGVIISCFAFTLALDAEGSIRLSLFGSRYSIVSSKTEILNSENRCHIVTCLVPMSDPPLIYLDGQQIATTLSTGVTAPVRSNQGITFGNDSANTSQYSGGIMNIGLWSSLLLATDFLLAGQGELRSLRDNLVGFWSLDGSLTDSSPNNNTLRTDGCTFMFMSCFDCLFQNGPLDYTFCQIIGYPLTGVQPPRVFNQAVSVGNLSPVLFASVIDNSGYARFPTGVVITITDPTGTQYGSNNINNSDVFCQTQNGALFSLVINNPKAGTWNVSISAPASSYFLFQVQATPYTNIKETLRQTWQQTLYLDNENLRHPVKRGLDRRNLDFSHILNIVCIGAVAALTVAVGVGTMPVAVTVALVAIGVELVLNPGLPVHDNTTQFIGKLPLAITINAPALASRYSENCYLCSHNAYSNNDEGWVYAQQTNFILTQLQQGARVLMLDIHPYTPVGTTSTDVYLLHDKAAISWLIKSGWTFQTLSSELMIESY